MREPSKIKKSLNIFAGNLAGVFLKIMSLRRQVRRCVPFVVRRGKNINSILLFDNVFVNFWAGNTRLPGCLIQWNVRVGVKPILFVRNTSLGQAFVFYNKLDHQNFNPLYQENSVENPVSFLVYIIKGFFTNFQLFRPWSWAGHCWVSQWMNKSARIFSCICYLR